VTPMKYIPYTLIVAIALLIFTGFIVDEGGQIEARQAALAIAQGAARSGTNAATGTAVNGDAFQLSGPAAALAAQQYIHAAGPGVTGTTHTDGTDIVVTVHATYQTRFASWIGITHLDAAGTAAARLIDHN
jgi:hypothetical protein